MSIKSLLVRAVLAALFASPCALLHAGSLQVAPVLVEVPAPGAASTLKLLNEGTKPINAQIRIFRWTQVNGADVLTPTDDVAASPPAASLRPGTDYTVRIVRTTKEPVTREEAYRLLVDELPEPAQAGAATVNIDLRYSIPVFFTTPGAPSKLSFDLQRGAKPAITVSNAGDRRVRLAKLRFVDGRGLVASFGDGLAGYVLGHSSRNFDVPASAKGFGMGGIASMSAQTDAGPIDLTH
ncbi:MAG TPA: molecular chaperone [Xanthobacteraceae bacterium]|nr:molecular chaperone [Xanthobacteraceae bacterium]